MAVVACLPAFPVLPLYAQKDLKHRVDSRMDSPVFNRSSGGSLVTKAGAAVRP